jgi:isopentenyl diphosphate isomerase/L-lactate dehydrogenase-like FMN-dependent dehydrogenase
MWPKSCEILAKAAKQHNVPFCLSTVGTASIETIADITEGDFGSNSITPQKMYCATNSLRGLLRRAVKP